MKALIKIAILLLPLGVSGCVIGNGRICGPQTPRIYCDKEAFDSLHNQPSLMERWQHPARPQIERPQDWIACGGSADGGYAAVSASTDAERVTLSRDNFDQIQRCMMGKGYRYTGTCEGKIPSQYPACQRPEGAAADR